jgi:hypothetical protein
MLPFQRYSKWRFSMGFPNDVTGEMSFSQCRHHFASLKLHILSDWGNLSSLQAMTNSGQDDLKVCFQLKKLLCRKWNTP